MITFKVAYRNVLRQKRRTLLTVMTMLGGFVLASFSIAWSDGAYAFVIDMFTRNQLGHIQLHSEGYLDRPTLYNTISDYEALGLEVEQVEGITAWSPRIFSAGLASVGEKSSAVRIVGLDPVRENETTRFDKKIIAGTGFSSKEELEAVLGRGLAEILKAEVGDDIVLLTQGADGSLANDRYRITGLVESGNDITDKTTVYLTLAEAQELLVLYGQVHEVAVLVDDLDDVLLRAEAISARLDRPGLAVEPWQEFARSFYTAMKKDQEGMWVTIFIIVLIVAVGVLNTVLMTVLERRREYGVLRAMGVRPMQVIRLVLYEVGVMAAGSVLIGSAISLGINYWFSQHGMSFGTFTYGGVEFSEMYTELNVRSFVIPAMTVLISAVTISLFPAVKAARTAPARAMRTH